MFLLCVDKDLNLFSLYLSCSVSHIYIWHSYKCLLSSVYFSAVAVLQKIKVENYSTAVAYIVMMLLYMYVTWSYTMLNLW